MIVGQVPIALAVGAGGGCLDIFPHLSFLFSFSLSLGDGTARCRLKYCLKGPLNSKQPTKNGDSMGTEYCLGGLILPRSSVVRLTDRPDMTMAVYRGRQAPTQ